MNGKNVCAAHFAGKHEITNFQPYFESSIWEESVSSMFWLGMLIRHQVAIDTPDASWSSILHYLALLPFSSF
jgi:hypothetical protein